MHEKIIIHSFGFSDRGGKVRWLAEELDLEIEEAAVEFGTQRKSPYRDINPYAVIPTVEFRDNTMIESNAICHFLAESFPEHNLTILPNEPERYEFLRLLSICSENLEARTVDYVLGKAGVLTNEHCDLYQKSLEFKYRVFLEEIPKEGFLVGERFTIADIIVSYSLRLAVRAELIDYADVENYLSLLADRPASKRAHFFKSIEDKLSKEEN